MVLWNSDLMKISLSHRVKHIIDVSVAGSSCCCLWKSWNPFAKLLDRSEFVGPTVSVVNASGRNWVGFATKIWKDHHVQNLTNLHVIIIIIILDIIREDKLVIDSKGSIVNANSPNCVDFTTTRNRDHMSGILKTTWKSS